MRKNISIGAKEYAFEANLGTTRLYQTLTGQNILKIMMNFKETPEKNMMAAQLYEVFLKLAYVMNVQATSETIKDMMARMTEESFTEWTFQFGLEDFNEKAISEIADLWAGTQKTNSTNDSKNA